MKIKNILAYFVGVVIGFFYVWLGSMIAYLGYESYGCVVYEPIAWGSMFLNCWLLNGIAAVLYIKYKIEKTEAEHG